MLLGRTGAPVALALLMVLAGACAGKSGGGVRSPDSMSVLDLRGRVTVDAKTGSIRLDLAGDACMEYLDTRDENGNARFERGRCVPFANDAWRTAHVRPPWGAQVILASSGGDSWVAFKIDWSKTGIDPFAKDAAARLGRPWKIESPAALEAIAWEPSQADQEIMLALIGSATDTETTVAEVSSPPSVVVKELRFDGELRDGASAELVLTVSNTGTGDAYRLYGTTRSNVPALHGLRLGFGRLAAGATKTRRARVSLPRENDETEALVVVAFSEANHYAPAQTSARFALLPALDLAQLSLTCQVQGAGGKGARPTVDAGATVQLSCEVHSARAAAHRVHVQAAISGGATSAAAGEPFDLAANASTKVAIAVEVPRGAPMDSEIAVTISAREEKAATPARTQLTLVVARPQICAEGKLTREQFVKKRAELRRALDARLLSKEEYEKYEAELVGCLEGD